MVCTWAMRKGYGVLFPARGLNPRYDMVLDTGDNLYTVQVKRVHSRTRNGREHLRVSVADSRGRTYEDLHFMALVHVGTGRIWLIPSWVLAGQKSVGLTSGNYREWLVADGAETY
jgi:hypothetical protein